MAVDDFGRTIAAPMAPPLSEMFVEITHESITSDPFPKWTSFIGVKADVDCCLAFSAVRDGISIDPVAEPEYHKVDAGELRYYGALEGGKVAVIEVV